MILERAGEGRWRVLPSATTAGVSTLEARPEIVLKPGDEFVGHDHRKRNCSKGDCTTSKLYERILLVPTVGEPRRLVSSCSRCRLPVA